MEEIENPPIMATSPLILEEKDFTGQSFILPNFHDTYPFIDPLKQDLKGKRIFISGASKGIGRALAIAYARAGASHIAIAARSDLSVQKKEVEDAARNAPRDSTPIVLSLNVDVTDWKSVKRTAEKIEAEFGGLDILINNAGYLSEFVRIVDADPEKWWRDWEVNVKGIQASCDIKLTLGYGTADILIGIFFAEKAFIPLLLKGEHKTIINMSSITAQLSGGWGSAYQTSKLAVNRITEHTFAEYKEEGLVSYNDQKLDYCSLRF